MYVRNNPLKYTDPTGNSIDWDNWMFWGTNNKIWEAISDAGEQIVLGNYTEKVTIIGTAGQIVTGIIGVDAPGDIRDMICDIQNWQWSWQHAGQTGIDMLAIVPIIGVIKYSDEAGVLIKQVGKQADNGAMLTWGKHIEDYKLKRGWSDESIIETVNNPTKKAKTTDIRHNSDGKTRRNDPATAYFDKDNHYVVVNDKTGEVVQISNKNDKNWEFYAK